MRGWTVIRTTLIQNYQGISAKVTFDLGSEENKGVFRGTVFPAKGTEDAKDKKGADELQGKRLQRCYQCKSGKT